MASASFDRLRKLLDELFQFDRADLDFGIYRIMNQTRAEVRNFLAEDLLPQVREALGTYRNTERETLQAELEERQRTARTLGMGESAINDLPPIRELRAKLAETADATDLEGGIYGDLYTFFSRYYKDGDFLSLRRYKPGVYAIPYEGEEVKLYWANADQYYVKSSEAFQDYRFRLSDGRHVHFKLAAAVTERDNNKAADGQERRFVLRAEDPVEEVGGELHVYFEYRPIGEKQAELNKRAATRLMELPEAEAWREGLSAPAPTQSAPGRTCLEKHLADYTARNSFDYFIHKDLGGFLRRELDFFLKNEVLHVDDLDTDDERRATQYMARLRAIKQVGYKIIDFLAQLEDFQKKLWLKKKFVVRADYCVTLDRVPEDLYPEIAANDAQREEWVRLFATDEIKVDTSRAAGYTEPLTEEFLRENPYLVLDTKFFDECFKARLLTNFDDLDAATDGLLVNSENFQALGVLRRRYLGQVKAVYIDPPYNTGNDGFMYKDNYQHSSWLSMITDRTLQVRELLAEAGVLFASIDDTESANLRSAFDQTLSSTSFVADITLVNNLKGRNDKEHIATANERLLIYKSPDFQEAGLELTEEQKSEYSLRDEQGEPYRLLGLRKRGGADTRSLRPNLFFPIYVNPANGRVSVTQSDIFCTPVVPLKSDGTEGCWRWGKDRVEARNSDLVGVPISGGRWDIFQKDRLFRDGEVRRSKPKSVWFGTDYSTDAATKELRKMLPGTPFTNPKPVAMLEAIVEYSTFPGDIVLDHFAGSGTTGLAVLNLNRQDGGNLKYILVEMGEYFDTVMKPRMQKVIYSRDWEDGKPVSREGSSHMFKYMTLESYEDTLNNLEVQRPESVQQTLDEAPEAREDYMLRYMLDLETRDSASLLNLERFEDPFNYELLISDGSETRATKVDLVETFNWLLGLRVHKMRVIDGYHIVEGTNPDGERVLVIWRSLKDDRHSNEGLEKFFAEQGYGRRTGEEALAKIYVNGDNTLTNLRETGSRWDVVLLEEEFRRLMFAPASEGVL